MCKLTLNPSKFKYINHIKGYKFSLYISFMELKVIWSNMNCMTVANSSISLLIVLPCPQYYPSKCNKNDQLSLPRNGLIHIMSLMYYRIWTNDCLHIFLVTLHFFRPVFITRLSNAIYVYVHANLRTTRYIPTLFHVIFLNILTSFTYQFIIIDFIFRTWHLVN